MPKEQKVIKINLKEEALKRERIYDMLSIVLQDSDLVIDKDTIVSISATKYLCKVTSILEDNKVFCCIVSLDEYFLLTVEEYHNMKRYMNIHEEEF